MQFFKNQITIGKKAELEEYLCRYPHETSGLSFTSLYLWRNQNEFSYEVIHDFLCIAGYANFEGFEGDPFVFPLLPLRGQCDGAKMKKALAIIMERFRDQLGQIYVQVTVVIEGEEIIFYLRDNAYEYNPLEEDTERVSLEKEEQLELMGLKIVQKKAKDFYYRRYSGFNTLVIRM